MIRKQVRQLLRSIYVFRCGYCDLKEDEMGADLAVDHFQPQSQGGTDDLDNLVYSCLACNAYKGDSWDPVNPLLLHPLRDNLSLHIAEQEDGTLLALTEIGRSHIAILQLNRRPLVRKRKRAALHAHRAAEQQAIIDKMASLEQTLSGIPALLAEFERLRRLH